MIRVVVFDAYGTLFDVAAAARRAADEPGREAFREVWQQVARDWRLKQMQYSWIRAITGAHADFWTVTQDGLDWALEAAGLANADLRERLLALYRALQAYDEVPEILAAVRERGVGTAILSNGSPDMLNAAVASAQIGGLLDAVLSVEAVGVFKPARAVYDLVGAEFGTRAAQVLFVSSNGWDVAAAGGYGFDHVVGQSRRRAGGSPALGAAADRARSDRACRDAGGAAVRFRTSDGLSLHYLDAGAGLPVLCLAGLTRDAADFDDLAAAWSGRHRLIRLTARGRGESDRDPDFRNYNVGVEARDAVELLDHLGLARVVVVGTSRGGLIAMVMAAAAKNRLSGVVLNDIGPEIAPGGLARIMGYLGIAPVARDYAEAARGLKAAMGAEFPGLPDSRWQVCARRWFRERDGGLGLTYDPRLRAAVEAASAQPAADMWPLFGALDGVPLAVIRGENLGHSDIDHFGRDARAAARSDRCGGSGAWACAVSGRARSSCGAGRVDGARGDMIDIGAIRAAAARSAGRIRRTPMLQSDALDRGGRSAGAGQGGVPAGDGVVQGAGRLGRALGAGRGGRESAVCWRFPRAIMHRVWPGPRAAHDAPAVILMPADAPAIKIAKTRALGAEVVLYERTGEDREALGARMAEARGLTLIPPFDHPEVIAGQGTCGLEIAEQATEAGVSDRGCAGVLRRRWVERRHCAGLPDRRAEAAGAAGGAGGVRRHGAIAGRGCARGKCIRRPVGVRRRSSRRGRAR